MQRKIVLVGAGSASFTRGLIADIILAGKEADIGLVDIDPEALACAENLARKMVEARKAPIRIEASTDRRDILPGATCVICTVAVGGRRAWEQDVFIPRRYGIYQPVGDTTMPGGISRALRMVPVMVEIAKDVVDLCPHAHFFNYSNPMTAICRAIRKETGARVVGLCHGVFHVAQYLASFIGKPFDEVTCTALGINHLTWFTELRWKGQDAWPLVREELARQRAANEGDVPDRGCSPIIQNRFSWELFERFGAFPAVLDRHVVEFFPQFFREGNYYGHKFGVDVFAIEETIAAGDACYQEMLEIASGEKAVPDAWFERSPGEHEQVIDILDSIETDAGRVYSVNVPNQGQVPNLPIDSVVECPAVMDASGAHPLAHPPLPTGLAGTLTSRIACIETTVEAALKGDRDLFVQALVLDGSVPSLETAEALADELLAAHAEHLPQFANR